METRIHLFKREIQKRMETAIQYNDEAIRVNNSETIKELMNVIKENFSIFCGEKIIDTSIIENFKKEFNDNDIRCNENSSSGFLLVSDCNIEYINGDTVAYIGSNSCVNEVSDNATILSIGENSIINTVFYEATIRFMEHNSVIKTVTDNVTIWQMWDCAIIQDLCGNATVWEMKGCSKVQNVRGHAIIQAICENSQIVNMWDNTYASSFLSIICKLHNGAVIRNLSDNSILCAADVSIKPII